MAPHILIIDGNADLCEVLEMGFSLPGNTVQTASNGFGALCHMVGDPSPDAVVVGDLDQRDPSASLELVNDLRVAFTGTKLPILMLSTHTTDDVRITALASGADRYLIKPQPLSTIVGTINELLEERAA